MHRASRSGWFSTTGCGVTSPIHTFIATKRYPVCKRDILSSHAPCAARLSCSLNFGSGALTATAVTSVCLPILHGKNFICNAAVAGKYIFGDRGLCHITVTEQQQQYVASRRTTPCPAYTQYTLACTISVEFVQWFSIARIDAIRTLVFIDIRQRFADPTESYVC